MNVRRSLHRITRAALLATAFGLISTSHAMVARPTASTPIPVPAVSAAQPAIGGDSRGVTPLLVAPTGCHGSNCATRATAPSVPLLVAPCHGGCYSLDPLAPAWLPAARSNEEPLLVAPGCPHCRPTRNIGQAQPSMQRAESFDATPVLVAPTGCHSGCGIKTNIGQSDSTAFASSQSVAGPGCRGSCTSGSSFDATPVLAAADCSSVRCNRLRFFG